MRVPGGRWRFASSKFFGVVEPRTQDPVAEVQCLTFRSYEWVRGEQALVSVVQQAYVCGVSTRRVDQLVERLGLRVSKSEVSRICEPLDEQVEAFRSRPLEGEYPYLWLDAKVEKVRDAAAWCTRPS